MSEENGPKGRLCIRAFIHTSRQRSACLLSVPRSLQLLYIVNRRHIKRARARAGEESEGKREREQARSRVARRGGGAARHFIPDISALARSGAEYILVRLIDVKRPARCYKVRRPPRRKPMHYPLQPLARGNERERANLPRRSCFQRSAAAVSPRRRYTYAHASLSIYIRAETRAAKDPRERLLCRTRLRGLSRIDPAAYPPISPRQPRFDTILAREKSPQCSVCREFLSSVPLSTSDCAGSVINNVLQSLYAVEIEVFVTICSSNNIGLNCIIGAFMQIFLLIFKETIEFKGQGAHYFLL